MGKFSLSKKTQVWYRKKLRSDPKKTQGLTKKTQVCESKTQVFDLNTKQGQDVKVYKKKPAFTLFPPLLWPHFQKKPQVNTLKKLRSEIQKD